jgi:hypothetical protein
MSGLLGAVLTRILGNDFEAILGGGLLVVLVAAGRGRPGQVGAGVDIGFTTSLGGPLLGVREANWGRNALGLAGPVKLGVYGGLLEFGDPLVFYSDVCLGIGGACIAEETAPGVLVTEALTSGRESVRNSVLPVAGGQALGTHFISFERVHSQKLQSFGRFMCRLLT